MSAIAFLGLDMGLDHSALLRGVERLPGKEVR
jgi:hypothetical protein